MLHAFDAPVMEVNCERRQSSTVATQSLMLMNSGFLLDQAGRFARRVQSEAGGDRAAQVRRAWQLAFGRPPRTGELADANAFLAQQVSLLSGKAASPSDAAKATDAAKTSPPKLEPEQQALTDLCQALLSANEFLYVD